MATNVKQVLDIFAREKISCLQDRQSQRQGLGLFGRDEITSQKWLVDSDRYQISLLGRRYLSLWPLGSDRDQIYQLGRRSILYRVGSVREGLDLIAREENSSLQGHQVQIVTKSLGKGGYISSLRLVESYRDQIFSQEKDIFFQGHQGQIGTRYLRQGEYFCLQGQQSQISSQERRSLVSSVNRVRQGLDPFARDEISTFQGPQVRQGIYLFAREVISPLQGQQSQIRTISFSIGRRYLVSRAGRFIQGLDIVVREEISSLGPARSDRGQIFALGRKILLSMAARSLRQGRHFSFISRACRVRQGLHIFVWEENSSLKDL